jgi:hypothetical protein
MEQTGRIRSYVRKRVAVSQATTVVLIIIVSAVVGSMIFGYGVAVLDVCLNAGLDQWSSSALSVLACAPILAALSSIDS